VLVHYESAAVKELLGTVSWDFPSANTKLSIHSMHPYPARFIQEIPRALIELFPPPPGTSVLDPFCGSGTTLVEAQNRNIDSLGIDLHPLACLIARVKTCPLTGDLVSEGSLVANRAQRADVPVPPIPRLDHWFQPPVQKALASIVGAIRAVADESLRNALSVALSRIIVRVSNQESDTRYAAVPKIVSADFVFSEFQRSVQLVSTLLSERFETMFRPNAGVRVVNADIRAVPERALTPVGLVVTSPPYPNAYEYWLYHKYRMYWLGMDPLAVRRDEIGARPHYFQKNPHTDVDFVLAMKSAFVVIADTLVDDGVACFLVGDSVIRGRKVDNLSLLSEAARASGFELLGMTTRRINENRKSFNRSIGRLKHEALAVFGRAER